MPNVAEIKEKRTELDVGRLGRPPVEPQIKRFDKHARKRLRKLVKSSTRLGDLLFSFPAAAYAIAVGGPGTEARAEAVAAVKAGEPLARVAEVLGLPGWFRRLPPEAFEAAIVVPRTGPSFARSVANAIPRPSWASFWLQAVVVASHASNDDAFTGWLAKQPIWCSAARAARGATIAIAAYAWHSLHAERGPARSAITRPWTKKMSFRTAATEARYWLERAITTFCMEDGAASASWGVSQRSGRFRIDPLAPSELEREGEVMGNCLATYRAYLERGGCLLYAVRRGNRSVASLEIRADFKKPGLGRVVQLEGRGNTRADEAVVSAVEKWLAKQGPCPLVPGGGLASRPVNPERWGALWEGFVGSIGPAAAGPFAMEPGPATLGALAHPLAALEEI